MFYTVLLHNIQWNKELTLTVFGNFFQGLNILGADFMGAVFSGGQLPLKAIPVTVKLSLPVRYDTVTDQRIILHCTAI